MAFCTECGANVPDNIKFCTGCGKPMGGEAQPAPAMAAAGTQTKTNAETAAKLQPAPPVYSAPVQQTAPSFQSADAPPPKGSRYAVMGMGAYIGTMILFAIPVIGWLACIVMAFASKNLNRRNFARAMLVFLIIGIVLSVALYFLFSWVWGAAQEYIQQYISEATGGAVTDFDGLKDFFDIFKGLDGLEIPSMPGQ